MTYSYSSKKRKKNSTNKCRAGDKLPDSDVMDKAIQAAMAWKKRYGYLLLIGKLTGFRINEILHLSLKKPLPGETDHRNYIDFDKGYIVISKQKNRRVNEPFFIFPELRQAINDLINLPGYKQKIDQNNGWLFWSLHGGRLSRALVACYVIPQVRKRAGLFEYYYVAKNGKKWYRFSMHSTRHFAINTWGNKCVEKTGIYDTNSIACLSRHKNPISLESYKVLNVNIRKKVAETLLF